MKKIIVIFTFISIGLSILCQQGGSQPSSVRKEKGLLNSRGDGDFVKRLFEDGNYYYERGKYHEALIHYNQIIKKYKYESGNLYYNIGNTYFKMNEIGKAIVNYERALRFIPDDADLRSNLDFANSLIKVKIRKGKEFILIRLIKKLSGTFTINGLTMFTGGAFFLFFILLSFYILYFRFTLKDQSRILIILVGAILLFSSVVLYFKIKENIWVKEAVVLKDSEGRYEPNASSTAYFSISEGNKVLVLKTRGGWSYIQRPDGKKAWINVSNIEII